MNTRTLTTAAALLLASTALLTGCGAISDAIDVAAPIVDAVGDESTWIEVGDCFNEIDLATFRLQIGYQNPLANFRAALRQIAGADTIPDYRLELIETVNDPDAIVDTAKRGRKSNPVRVVITRRPALLAESAPLIGPPTESRRDAGRESMRDSISDSRRESASPDTDQAS